MGPGLSTLGGRTEMQIGHSAHVVSSDNRGAGEEAGRQTVTAGGAGYRGLWAFYFQTEALKFAGST